MIFKRHEPTFNPSNRVLLARQILRDDDRTEIVTRDVDATFILARLATERTLMARPLLTRPMLGIAEAFVVVEVEVDVGDAANVVVGATTAVGVTEADGAEGDESADNRCAVSVNVYAVPLESPVIVHDPVAELMRQVLPRGFDVITWERGTNPALACPTVMVALPSPATTDGAAGVAGAEATTFTVILNVAASADDLN